MASPRVLQSLKSNNNCSNFNTPNFVIDENTNLKEDVCYDTGQNLKNDGVNDYMLSNYASCDCNIGNVLDVSTKNRGLTVKDGYGVSDCNIDDDTVLRIGQTERHYKTDLQLFPRPFLTSPNVSRGDIKPDLESKIQSSLLTVKHSQMQNVSESNIYTPLTENLARTVQNPNNIIQENADIKWLRGGVPSRQVVRDMDYFSRSADSQVVKQLLRQKKSYL